MNKLKIKEVSKLTGLTDKAIRVYINNELIHPTYTENYTGRKNFDFSEDDVNLLKKIALLRKYNFSLADIKELISDRNLIDEILDRHITTTKEVAVETSFILKNLKNAQDNEPEDLEQLCEILSENLQPESFDLFAYLQKLWVQFKRKIPIIILFGILGLVVSIGIIAGLTFLLTVFFTNL